MRLPWRWSSRLIQPKRMFVCLRRGLSVSIERLLWELIARSFPLPSGCVGKGHVLGGAYGYTHYGWLYLSLLWVDEALRGQGLGTQVVERFEAEGAARGCHAAWLDTYEFQAPTFYQRLGYQEFGRLEDFPPGSVRIFFWKPLQRAVRVAGAGRDS